MGYKSILIHLDQTSRSMARFELALDLAARQGAVLKSYYATSMPYVTQHIGGFQEEQLTLCREMAAKAGVALIEVSEAEELAPQPLEARLNYQTLFADLCVIGQPGKEAGGFRAAPRDLPEKLVLTCGRPVLTVPFAGNFKRVGQRVMLAWRSGRASSRALCDALPLMVEAETVHLVSFAGSRSERAKGESGMQRLCGYLAEHGVNAVCEMRLIEGIRLGDALLNRVAEEGIDLLVAGGALPGAPAPLAEQLLKEMTVPVLMSS